MAPGAGRSPAAKAGAAVNTQQFLLFAALAAALYLWMGGGANATTTGAQLSIPGESVATQNSQQCAEAYRQEYSAEWASMNTVQRLAVGLKASGECAP